MITDYHIVEAGDDDELEDAVKIAIQDGWQPFGGVAVTSFYDLDWHDEPFYWYCQAMVKYGEG